MTTPRAVLSILALAAAAASAYSAEARAIETRSSHLEYHDGRYEVELEVHIDAPLPTVWSIMTDYDRLDELDDALIETRRLHEPDDPSLVYTQMRDCILLFCRKIERVERITEVPQRQIMAIALPERSDVKFAQSSWSLIAEGGGTTVRYRLIMEPDFWIPKFVGRKRMLAQMAETGLRMFTAVEARAAAEHAS